MSVHQSARAIVGHCPKCYRVIVILNNHEMWDAPICMCGWSGTTHQLSNRQRYGDDGTCEHGPYEEEG